MSNFLFLFNGYQDIDHIAPMVWKCLEKGDRCIAIFEQSYPYKEDYRIQFLMKYPRFEVLSLLGGESKSYIIKGVSRIIWNNYILRLLLRRIQISACFFEWGDGVLPYGRLQILTELIRNIRRARIKKFLNRTKNFLPSLFVILIQSLFLKPLRIRLIMAAKKSHIPIFALPHGVNTKMHMDHNPIAVEIMKQNNGQLPREDRNCFTAWVFSAEFERQLSIRYNRMDPMVAQTWGSLRFCPEWMAILKEICPKPALPAKKIGQIRLLFFMPKWYNFVNKEETIALLNTIAKRNNIQMFLKTHPRKGVSELEEDYLAYLLEHQNVVLASEAHSSALIICSDVVIDMGSGMSIDILLRGKYLIYPSYLHKIRVIFDEKGGCLVAQSHSDVHQFLDKIIKQESYVEEGDTQSIIRDLVYGGKEAFDVPEYYYQQVRNHVSAFSS